MTPRPAWRVLLLAIPVICFLYFFGLTGVGLLGPDEPRYAAIGREMARSGDWVTPRLWGEPWFEKPALVYWMSATGFRLGLSDDLAPRLPIALVSVAFLAFFYWVLRREFGNPAAGYATVILGTSAGWLTMSHAGVTDVPMSAAFAAAMLLSLRWLESGERSQLSWAGALLGAAVLAKGLVPLVLALPLAWMGRKRLLDWARPLVAGAFLVAALPWYVLCFLRNGRPFLEKFFWQQQVERFSSGALAHGQPFWFFVPVFIAMVFPWIPVLVPVLQRSLYTDRRRRFLLVWVLFGLVFFSASTNKLPGYVLPLMPAAAALAGIALTTYKHARIVMVASSALLVFIAPLVEILPNAVASGISRTHWPAPHWAWLLPLVACGVVWYLERTGHRPWTLALMVVAITAATIEVEVRSFPAVDRLASARPLWHEVEPIHDHVCVARLHRSLRYGLNYYSLTPLPDCQGQPREIEITQEPGSPPRLVNAAVVPARLR